MPSEQPQQRGSPYQLHIDTLRTRAIGGPGLLKERVRPFRLFCESVERLVVSKRE